MINFNRIFKNFGLLETLVISSLLYVIAMLLWTASTRSKIKKDLIQSSEDHRIQAEGKAGQSTDKGIIFVSSNDFNSEPGSEWIIGTCVKSPCVAAGNNELVSVYR